MRMIFGGTDRGLVRPNNQDYFDLAALSDRLAFAVLCDGIGGENGGGIASGIAVEFAASMLRRDLAEGMSELSLRSVLTSAITGANAMVQQAAQADQALSGMGTTMIAAVVSGDTLYAAHVGDSRVYLISGETEALLSRDHTLVQMLVDQGELAPGDAVTHPKRHYLTRAVGVGASVDVDFLAQPLQPGDIVLLCSDGLYQYLRPGQLAALAREALEQESVDCLIDHAKASGGSDNITVVITK